ncbi:MAG: methyltransferase domain-containing protein [Deltaproteobacteria bacterium]|nr:methyltransferase domain-containing protein [Deltaproteobacteria bacterium]
MDSDATETIRVRYDRISRFYDLMEAVVERAALWRWRRRAFDAIDGNRVLEVGVGTGKNLGFYPTGKSITAVDFSPGMLKRARRKADKILCKVDLRDMDVENLSFGDRFFDTVVATFVFCSVAHPVRGLSEVGRVCKQRGRIILLEHVRPGNKILARFFDMLNPVTLRLVGVNINRNTTANVERAGLEILREENLFSDIVKLIVARPRSG